MADRKFDQLYEKYKAVWQKMALEACTFAKSHISKGSDPLAASQHERWAMSVIVTAMKTPNLLPLLTLSLGLVGVAPFASAQMLSVKIVNRQDRDTDYTYQVPGHTTTTTTGSASCYGSDTMNCQGSSTTQGTIIGSQTVPLHVSGATLSLLLPDGRIAVVNCTSKFQERFAGRQGNHRNCRVPLVDTIQADFKGKATKLIWPASIDGKKMETETYAILSVIPKPATEAETPSSPQ